MSLNILVISLLVSYKKNKVLFTSNSYIIFLIYVVFKVFLI